MTATRLAVTALALVACAWFVLGIRQAHEISSATAIVNANTLKPAAARRASDLLDSASTLNPDQEVDILRGRIALDENRLAKARSIFAAVIHREPKNLDAWVWYSEAASDNPVAYIASQIGIKRLVRTFPPPRG